MVENVIKLADVEELSNEEIIIENLLDNAKNEVLGDNTNRWKIYKEYKNTIDFLCSNEKIYDEAIKGLCSILEI